MAQNFPELMKDTNILYCQETQIKTKKNKDQYTFMYGLYFIIFKKAGKYYSNPNFCP